MKYIFETRMMVRDYECDIEGIVNNANYLHYTEHTRHLFLKSRGLSFAEMHRKGVDAVVARMNLKFKTPLQCDDEFISRLALRKDGLKYVFLQDIFRASDEKLCFHGEIDIVCLVNGRLATSEEYDKALLGKMRSEECGERREECGERREECGERREECGERSER